MSTELCAVAVTVNGKPYQREVEARLLLSDFLRHELTLAVDCDRDGAEFS